MKVTIAKCTNEELNILQKLFCNMFELFPERQNIDYPKTENGIEYLRDKIENGIAFSAKNHDDTIGFIFGSIQQALPFKTYEKFGFIENLYVQEEYRRQNVGTMLIEQFIKVCREKTVYVIHTDSDFEQNLMNFFAKNNFKISGVNYSLFIDSENDR